MTLRLYLPILFCASVLSQTALADWTTYLNGNGRAGGTVEKIGRDLELKWIHASPAPPEMAWEGPRSEPIEGKLMKHRVAFDNVLNVAVADGKLFFGSSVDNKVYCVDAASGELQWEFFTDGPIRLAPTVWQDKVYVGSDDGLAYCLSAAKGDVIWQHRVGPSDERLLARGRMISRWPVRTSVLIDDGVAYFGAGVLPHETVYLCAADAETGKLIWKNDRISQEDAGRNPLSPQGYLLASGELLFVPSGRSLPAAFDKKTGEQVHQRTHSWRSTAGGVVGGSKALLADGQIYSAGAHHFVALDQKTGAVGFAYITGRQLSLSGDKAFVADGKNITALDRLAHVKATRERQSLFMKRNDLQRKRNSMKAEDYREQEAALSKKIAELSEFGSLWQTPSNSEFSLVVTDELVFAGGKNQVVAFDAASGKQVWSAPVEGEAGGLAISDGRLFVSTDTGKIFSFAEKTAAPRSETVAKFPKKRIASPYKNDELTATYIQAAEAIIKRSGIEGDGFCLIVGSEKGRLAFELARRSKMRIYGIEADEAKVAESRRLLDSAGLHGTRITIVHGDPSKMPFSNYFANVVTSDTALLTGRVPGDAAEIARRVKPCGGVACFVSKDDSADAIKEAVANVNVEVEGKIEQADSVVSTSRGKLPGSGDWSHQYGDVANTSSSNDYRVKGGMGVLWYGDPGPAKMINRHEAAAAPLSTNGRMFIQGVDNIMCYDAYNGIFYWEYKNPGAIRTGVFNNEEASNLAASDDALFVAVDNTCTVLDAATGNIRAEYKTPESPDKLPRSWGYVAHHDGLLFGTSTIRSELEAALRRRGHTVKQQTDAIFAVDTKTGERKWTYRGDNILHVTIAIGDGRVFFIDSSITSEERDALLRQDKTELKKLGPEEAKKKEEELKKLDVRKAVALDAATGELLWSQPVDVTDCSRVGIGGGQLTLMYHDGHVLICGANANGHYWRQFLSGQFSQRRLVVLESESGKKLWHKDANYRHRPIIVGDEIIAEPFGFALHTGAEKKRENPLTGEQTEWQFSRPGHHCGPLTATPNMLFFRSGFTGYYDLYSDSGTSHFAGHRLGCWVNAIPGNGLLMIPEASAGCVCQFSVAATIVMEPREDRDTWRVYSALGAKTPVKKLAVNFGAPGDRRDSFGTLWLGYPRPNTVGRLEYTFDLNTKMAAGGKYFANNSQSLSIDGADTPWVLSSGARGLLRCEIPLLGKEDKPATYTVKLYFAENEEVAAGERVFGVKLQGAIAADAVDVVKESGGVRHSLVRKFENVSVTDNLVIELEPLGEALPILSAVEVDRD